MTLDSNQLQPSFKFGVKNLWYINDKNPEADKKIIDFFVPCLFVFNEIELSHFAFRITPQSILLNCCFSPCFIALSINLYSFYVFRQLVIALSVVCLICRIPNLRFILIPDPNLSNLLFQFVAFFHTWQRVALIMLSLSNMPSHSSYIIPKRGKFMGTPQRKRLTFMLTSFVSSKQSQSNIWKMSIKAEVQRRLWQASWNGGSGTKSEI